MRKINLRNAIMLFNEWLDNRGMTRAEAAALLDTSPTTITLWYHGRHRPSARMTQRIFQLTEGMVTVTDLQRAYEMARAT